MIRDMTFGDMDDANAALIVPVDEAALIVIDMLKAIGPLKTPEDNPIVCAVMGDEEDVRKEMAKYAGNHRYQIHFYPAEK